MTVGLGFPFYGNYAGYGPTHTGTELGKARLDSGLFWLADCDRWDHLQIFHRLFISAMSSKGIALITGAGASPFLCSNTTAYRGQSAQGIGRSIALRLADDGFDVAVNDVVSNTEKLDALVDEIEKKGRAASKYIADVSQDEQVKEMVERVVEKHGGLDVVRVSLALSLPRFLLNMHGLRWLRMRE